MPLGIEQNNHLLSLTLDVWQDQIFFNDSAFPAGYFAADILNVGDETMQELLIHGGEISFQVEALANAEREEFIKLLPETRASLEKMLDALSASAWAASTAVWATSTPAWPAPVS